MKIRQQTLVFDAADPDAVSTFWAGVLGGSVDAEDDWRDVHVEGEPRPAGPPDWRHGAPRQVHLDLAVEDIHGAHAQVMGLGATLLRAARDLDAASGFQVYADPAGHPFCLCWEGQSVS